MQQTAPWHERLILQLITLAVIGNGVVIMMGALQVLLHPRSGRMFDEAIISLPLVIGLTLVYLGTLLHRRKQAAWAVVVPVYTFILGFNTVAFFGTELSRNPWIFVRMILLPLSIVACLVVFRNVFTVKSAIQNFTISIRVIIGLFALILLYGTVGYLLLDQRDFHQEISIPGAIQRTIDQFDFTTEESLTSYTRRGTVFMESLNLLSAVAVGYAIISLFQPIRAKLASQTHSRQQVLELLKKDSKDSEDFFKVWPTDKSYFFDKSTQAALAYRVQKGVALVVGDPVGNPKRFENLLRDFFSLCWVNDWLIAISPVTDTYQALYESYELLPQKIGEEAVVNIKQFNDKTIHDKYFRQINNKFERNHYKVEALQPPHSPEVISRLKAISDDWLTIPGRQERGFMMGYWSEEYVQQCVIIAAKDDQGTIQGFLNEVPTYQNKEANYDMLRHSQRALGNINDFVLMGFIKQAEKQGYKQVNLGLCPWAGLDKEEEKNLLNSAMHYFYANSNRFYSFSGLRRFKAKYQPEWRNRYIMTKGGVRRLSRAGYALNKAMSRTR